METHTDAVARHYGGRDIASDVLEGLRRAGANLEQLTIDDLAPADEVHTRGREATVELAALTGITPALAVLDVGGGVGGPARYLASTFGCRVTGVDLTAEFVAAANELSACVGLGDRVRFECASALEMPFEDACFDLVWTVQMQMNIADKPALYAEIARVLKPGGRLVFQDIVRGPTAGPLPLPVPWASTPEQSHLVPAGELREIVLGAGFTEVLWRDATPTTRDWTLAQAARPRPATEPPVGIHLVLGPDAWEKRRNSSRCLLEGRIGFVQGVFELTGEPGTGGSRPVV